MSHTGSKLKSTSTYLVDENLDPNPSQNIKLSKNNTPNNLLQTKSKAFPKQEAILGSYYLNSQNKNANETFDEVDFDQSYRKYSDSIMNTENSFADDSLYTLSKIGSHILTSECKGNNISFDRLSIDNTSAKKDNSALSKKESKILVQEEMKAIKFSRAKEYRRWFERLWRWSEFRRKTRELFIEFADMQNKRIIIDLVYDLKKVASYRKITERRSGRISYRSTNSLNMTYLENETERASKSIYRYFLLRKTVLTLKKRINHKYLKVKAEKFLYYKLHLKYFYRWVEYMKMKPILPNNLLHQSSNFTQTFQPSFFKNTQESYIFNINEEEDSVTEFYYDKLLIKALKGIQDYSSSRKKKKILQELLLDYYGNKYVVKPFHLWFWYTKSCQLKNKATIHLKEILLKKLYEAYELSFIRIKMAERVRTVAKKRATGVIKRQSHLISKDKSFNKFEEQSTILYPNEDKENYNTENKEKSFDQPRPKAQMHMKNYLASVFPDQKRKTEEQTNTQRNYKTLQSVSTYNSIFSLRHNLPPNHSEESNISLNVVPLDISQFGGEKSIQMENPGHLSRYFHRSSPIRPRQSLNHSFFGLNTSKIEKEDNTLKDKKNSTEKRESFSIQKSLQEKYFSIQRQKRESRAHGRASSTDRTREQNKAKSFSVLNSSRKKKDELNSGKSLQYESRNVEINNIRYSVPERRRSRSIQSNVLETTGPKEKEIDVQKIQTLGSTRGSKGHFKQMIDDLQEHLKFLNRSLMNKKLTNKKLVHVYQQYATENTE